MGTVEAQENLIRVARSVQQRASSRAGFMKGIPIYFSQWEFLNNISNDLESALRRLEESDART